MEMSLRVGGCGGGGWVAWGYQRRWRWWEFVSEKRSVLTGIIKGSIITWCDITNQDIIYLAGKPPKKKSGSRVSLKSAVTSLGIKLPSRMFHQRKPATLYKDFTTTLFESEQERVWRCDWLVIVFFIVIENTDGSQMKCNTKREWFWAVWDESWQSWEERGKNLRSPVQSSWIALWNGWCGALATKNERTIKNLTVSKI